MKHLGCDLLIYHPNNFDICEKNNNSFGSGTKKNQLEGVQLFNSIMGGGGSYLIRLPVFQHNSIGRGGREWSGINQLGGKGVQHNSIGRGRGG